MAKQCAWCDSASTQFRMLQRVCDNCAAAHDVHDQKWGHWCPKVGTLKILFLVKSITAPYVRLPNVGRVRFWKIKKYQNPRDFQKIMSGTHNALYILPHTLYTYLTPRLIYLVAMLNIEEKHEPISRIFVWSHRHYVDVFTQIRISKTLTSESSEPACFRGRIPTGGDAWSALIR